MKKFDLQGGWLYTPDFDNTARYLLGEPAKGKNLCCFGINPSTAEPNNLDNTLKTVSAIAKKRGYDGWIMMNIYPHRATNPNDMHDEVHNVMHKRNLDHIKQAIDEYDDLVFWAAWGTLIEKRKYLPRCLLDIAEIATQYDRPWITIGNRSKKGHPHHPLYLNHQADEENFNVNEYILNSLQRD